MKRFLFALSAFAILSFAAGCTREAGDVSGEGNFVKATFNVSLDGGMDTKVISDGSQINFLIFWAFDKDGLPLQDLEQFAEVRDKKATITVKLIRGVEYNFAFWAQHRVERTEETYWVCYGPKVDAQGNYMKDDQGEYIIDDTVPYMAALMGYEQMEEEMMNNDLYDAFYAKCHVDPLDADLSQDVTLTRPLAQINLAVDSEDLEVAASNNLDMDALTSALDITGQKDHALKVLDGTTITNPEYPATLSYYFQPVPGDDITSGNKTYKRLGMIYVLANEDPENLDITFRLRTVQNGSIDVEIKREIKNVPVRRNYRTNIVGKLFSVGGTFNVTVDPGFATPDNEKQIDQPAPPTLYGVDPDNGIEHGVIDFVKTGDDNYLYAEGETVALTSAPENGYALTRLWWTPANDETDEHEIDLKTLTFEMPGYDVNLYATFTLISPYTGSGTAADPYTVADVRYYIDNDLQDGVKVYIKGKVSGTLSNQYGTNSQGYGTFFIVDNPGDSNNFEAYKAKFLGGISWATGHPILEDGDEVVIYGEPSLYNTTYQINQGGFLYSLNGISSAATTPTIKGLDPHGDPASVTEISADTDGQLYVSIEAGSGETIYYTTDGTDPTPNSKQYSDVFVIYDACTVKAIATKAGLYDSAIASETFTKADANKVITINLNAQAGYNNGEAVEYLTIDPVEFTTSKGTNTNNSPKYYSTGDAVRFYGGNTFSLVSSGKAIEKIQLTFASGEGTNTISTTDSGETPGTFATDTWTGFASSVTFTIGGTSGHRRISKIVITLAK